MAVGYSGLPPLTPINGVRIGTACAGIKVEGRKDLVVFELNDQCQTAAVFTKNAFCAAPVVVAKEHISSTSPKYLIINTGNANAGTGQQGMDDANRTCQAVAENCHIEEGSVLPFSTGVIGETLPIDKIVSSIPDALESLNEDNWANAAEGIMTTDTVAKGESQTVEINGQTVTITGISKGSGMIRPDMATMLAYVATDAVISKELLQKLLTNAVNHSFNRVTVDGDTSTNDSCILMATGRSGITIEESGAGFGEFEKALTSVCQRLAQLIIRDGEGANKFVTIDVSGGQTEAECEQVAYTVAHSPLVKTALFASDPNWGRILAAVGRAGVNDMDLNAITIALGDTVIVENGGRADSYTEEAGQKEMSTDEVTISINLARGSESATVWTCDFSYDYVKINAEYRT